MSGLQSINLDNGSENAGCLVGLVLGVSEHFKFVKTSVNVCSFHSYSKSTVYLKELFLL